MNIVVVGLGNIGSYFFTYLKKNKNILFNKTNTIPNILYASARSMSKKRNLKIPKKLWLKVLKGVIRIIRRGWVIMNY